MKEIKIKSKKRVIEQFIKKIDWERDQKVWENTQ